MSYRDDLAAALARIESSEKRAADAETELARLRGANTEVARRRAPGERVYIGIGGQVLAVSTADGGILWTSKLGMAAAVNVVLEGDALYASTMGRVTRLKPATGEKLWTNPLRRMGHGLPSLAPVPDGLSPGILLYVGIASTVLALDAATGEERWRQRLGGAMRSEFTNVVLLGFELYATTLGEMWRLDPATGAVRWHDPLKKMGLGLAAVAPAGLGQFALLAEHIAREQARRAAGT